MKVFSLQKKSEKSKAQKMRWRSLLTMNIKAALVLLIKNSVSNCLALSLRKRHPSAAKVARFLPLSDKWNGKTEDKVRARRAVSIQSTTS